MTADAADAPVREPDAGTTPMLRQYLEVKAKDPGALLFFRLGDFYELFFEDAKLASAALGLTLTSRPKGEGRIPMAGVPFHAAKGYIRRLVEQGHRVAVCDQMEAPGEGKGIVRREVTRVVTPGTLLDEADGADALEARWLAALLPGEGGGGALALLDASTGELRCLETTSDEAIREELLRAQPREVLLPAPLDEHPLLAQVPGRRETREAIHFTTARAEALLRERLGVATLDGFGLKGKELAVRAAGAALQYVEETQRARATHVSRIELVEPGGRLLLDPAARAHLEIFRGPDGRRTGTLFSVVDRTSTSAGSRKLARWLAEPLLSLLAIAERHDAVGELAEKALAREDFVAALKGVQDLERLLGRLVLSGPNAGSPRDAGALGASLAALPRIAELARACVSPLLASQAPRLVGLEALASKLATAIRDDAPALARDGGFMRPGYDAELDELTRLLSGGKGAIAELEARERARTGITSLKVRYNNVFGYYLEVTKANLAKIPPDYVRKQTTANAERYVTPELSALEDKVLHAEERSLGLELRLFSELRAVVAERAADLRRAADALATLDALVAFARCAAEYGYVRPTVDESEELDLVGARHPVVERALGAEPFVPNDLKLDGGRKLVVLTGPNMAGKSTVMRQVALIQLLAQAGSFVPAERARLGVADRLFTRVGAGDDLARGQSTFMVEMAETSAILRRATRRSLLILDEIGRGTSTFDGLSIAWAVAEHLHDAVQARTLFATHYHELTDLARERSRVVNLSMAVRELDLKIVFLRKLVPGGATKSFGIQVARLAGLPDSVVARAREVLANLETAELDPEGRPTLAGHGRRAARTAQLGLFGAPPQPAPTEPPPPTLSPEERGALDTLRALDVNATTPLAALTLLAELARRLRG